jgi:hypothetical protein
MHAFTHARLGETQESFTLTTLDDLIQGATILVAQARRHINIIVPERDPGLYSAALFIDTLAAFTRGSRYRQTRILIPNGLQMLQNNFSLVDLSHRVSAGIEIRVCPTELRAAQRPCILVDSYGILLGPDDRAQTLLRFNSPADVEPRNSEFQRTWDHGGPSEELRRLSR